MLPAIRQVDAAHQRIKRHEQRVRHLRIGSGQHVEQLQRLAEHDPLKAKLVDYAAHLMEMPVAQLEFRDGAVRMRTGKGPSYSIKELAGRAHWNTESLPDGMEPGLQATAVFGFTVWKRWTSTQ